MPEQLALLSAIETPTANVEQHELFVVRESRRARRLFLHVVPPLGIELVVPRGTRPREVEAFVTRHRGWIEAARREIEHRYEGERNPRPRHIELKAIGEAIEPRYEHQGGRRAPFEREGRVLAIRCRRPDLGDAGAVLKRWLMSEAKRVLPRWLMAVGRDIELHPKRVQIRLQKTRWGSCSSHGTISLNASLMLLEPRLVRYLLIHELVHLVHMGHSQRYWRRVARHEPECRAIDAELSAAWTRIPYWVVAP
jgi:predicted metal-dependent hydrolase